MARCILILILVSPAFAFYLQDIDPGLHAGPERAGASVGAVCEDGGGFPRADCLCPAPEDDGGRHPAAITLAFLERDAGPGRGGPGLLPGHGRCPVLSCLCDSLFLSRPPPAASGRS